MPDLADILSRTRTIAVLGAHADPVRPAHWVAAWLAQVGYRVLPVNPELVGTSLFGRPVRATLAEAARLDGPVDLVDVFRRPSALPAHVDDLLAMDPLPRVVWFQQGIRHDEVAARLRAAGIEVVQDRCTYAEHRRLGLGPVAGG